jgi:hypothetical protein
MDSLARIAAEPVMAVAVVDHGISLQEGNPTTLMDLFKVLPKGWSQRQCGTCGMVFALPPLDELSGIKAKDTLTEELERHRQQRHVDLPSDWEAASMTSLDDSAGVA